MKFYFILVVLVIPNITLCQNNDSTQVLELISEYHCSQPLLYRIIGADTRAKWGKFSSENIKFQQDEFNQLKQRFQSKTKYSGVLSDYVCVHLSNYSEFREKEKIWKDVYVYEIEFEYDFQSKKVMDSVKKYKVETLDWVDASPTVRFHRKGGHILLFIDDSDDSYEKEAKVWFHLMVDDFIKRLD